MPQDLLVDAAPDYDVVYDRVAADEPCAICYESGVETRMRCCRQALHAACLQQWCRHAGKVQCPLCRRLFCWLTAEDGHLGRGPRVGRMSWHVREMSEPLIIMAFDFPAGWDGPRRLYKERQITAYLPASSEGQEALALLRQAFRRRLLFPVAASQSHPGRTWPTLGGFLHLKTFRPTQANAGDVARFAPYALDPGYVARLRSECHLAQLSKVDLFTPLPADTADMHWALLTALQPIVVKAGGVLSAEFESPESFRQKLISFYEEQTRVEHTRGARAHAQTGCMAILHGAPANVVDAIIAEGLRPGPRQARLGTGIYASREASVATFFATRAYEGDALRPPTVFRQTTTDASLVLAIALGGLVCLAIDQQTLDDDDLATCLIEVGDDDSWGGGQFRGKATYQVHPTDTVLTVAVFRIAVLQEWILNEVFRTADRAAANLNTWWLDVEHSWAPPFAGGLQRGLDAARLVDAERRLLPIDETPKFCGVACTLFIEPQVPESQGFNQGLEPAAIVELAEAPDLGVILHYVEALLAWPPSQRRARLAACLTKLYPESAAVSATRDPLEVLRSLATSSYGRLTPSLRLAWLWQIRVVAESVASVYTPLAPPRPVGPAEFEALVDLIVPSQVSEQEALKAHDALQASLDEDVKTAYAEELRVRYDTPGAWLRATLARVMYTASKRNNTNLLVTTRAAIQAMLAQLGEGPR